MFGNRRSRNTSSPVATALFGLIFTLVGCAFTGIGLNSLYEGWQTESWPSTTGRITAHEIDRSTDSDGDTDYTPILRYSYTVAGQRFTGTRIAVMSQTYGTEPAAQAKLDQYPIESQHSVYYNPDDPAQSVLEPGLTFGSYVFPGVGSLFVPFGVLTSIRGATRFLTGGLTMQPGT